MSEGEKDSDGDMSFLHTRPSQAEPSRLQVCVRAAAAAAVAVTAAAAAAASVCTDSAHRQETHAAKARTFLQFSCRHHCKQTSREASGFSELLHFKKKGKKGGEENTHVSP